MSGATPEGTVTAAALHGLITGVVAAGPGAAATRTGAFERLLGKAAPADTLAGMTAHAETVETELASAELDFSLIVPDDDAPAPERLEALAEWCAGFLEGARAVLPAEADLAAEDVREVLDDFAQIAAAEAASADEDDRAELDLFTVSEHVRLGALVVYTSMRGR